MNEVLELATYTVTTDAIGQQIRQPSYREVYAERMPIRASEHLTAGQQGIKPEVAYRIWGIEYADEEVARVNGKLYRIYRVYRDTQHKVELYCEAMLREN